eukprot:5605788-Pyramimonas_sp.AAC.1
MPIRCPYCRANDNGSVAALLPGAPPPNEAQAMLQLRDGLLAPMRPPISYSELADATLSLAAELGCLRADL